MSFGFYIEQLPTPGEPRFNVRITGDPLRGTVYRGSVTRRDVYELIGTCKKAATELTPDGSVSLSYVGPVRSSERHNFDSHAGKKSGGKKVRKQLAHY
jgi:hypothetical protein